MLIFGERHLFIVLRKCVDRCNGHRLHRSLGQRPPDTCECLCGRNDHSCSVDKEDHNLERTDLGGEFIDLEKQKRPVEMKVKYSAQRFVSQKPTISAASRTA